MYSDLSYQQLGYHQASNAVRRDHRRLVGISGCFYASTVLGWSVKAPSLPQVLLPIGLFCLDTNVFLVKITVQVVSTSCRGGRECHWSVSF